MEQQLFSLRPLAVDQKLWGQWVSVVDKGWSTLVNQGQCFDFPSLPLSCFGVTWRASDRRKPVPIIPKGSVPEKMEKNTEGNWLIQINLESSR